MATTDRAPGPPTAVTDAGPVAWYAVCADDVAGRLGVDTGSGLSGAEAASRLASVGPNMFAVAAVEPRWRAFVRQYRDPMQIVLLVAGIGSPPQGAGNGPGPALPDAVQRGARPAAGGQGGGGRRRVAEDDDRQGARSPGRGAYQIPAEELVPGDVVSIEAGDVVPADGRLLSAATLEVAESALTGESLPVSKGVQAL